MTTRSKILLAATVAVLAAGGYTVFNKNRQSAAKAQVVGQASVAPALEFLATDIALVKTGDLRQTLALSGALRAVNQVQLKARVGGDVRDVLVREGEAVKAGQVLVRMDDTEYRARLAQARGSLLAAQGQREISVKARDNNQALLAQGFISKNASEITQSQFAIAQANVDTARGALDVAQKSVDDTVIRAPFAGLISSRTVQPGEKISVDHRLLDIVDLQTMELEASVPTSDIQNIVLGQEVMLSIEGLEEQIPGRVARINPATQSGSRSILVYISVANPQNRLRVGMFADARLTLAKRSAVLSVPQSAVQEQTGAASVYAIENGVLQQKPVTLGIRGNDGVVDAVEITAGLSAGQQVIRNNLGNLRSGTRVKMAAGQPPAPAAP
jgi:membrane fusion protein (multidrug efflux system)